MGKKSRTKEGKRKKKKIGKKEINPKQKREEEERKGKREWDDGSTKRRWGSVGSTSSKSFRLDFEGGGRKRRRERERKEGRARDDGKGMDGIPLAEFRQAAEPVSASFQLLWLRCWKVGVDGFLEGRREQKSNISQSQ